MAAVSMAMPLTSATQKGLLNQPKGLSSCNVKSFPSSKAAAFSTSAKKPRRGSSAAGSFRVDASLRERAVAGATAAALAASMVIPEVASAADSSLTPSLKNFLLSIAAGGIVLAAIGGAVVGVSNFDPVKRT